MKLDIGAGNALEDGWMSWDIKDGRNAIDLSEIADGSVDEIRASHVLEHIPMAGTIVALREWNRVLRSGGRLFVSVPDFARIVGEMLGGRADPNLCRYIMGGQTDEHDFHYAIFTGSIISAYLRDAGFERIKPAKAEGANTSQHWCSLNMEAYSP